MNNPKPRLILHVGTPKTGTTTLQQSLNASRGRLLRKGILYPNLEMHPLGKHQWIVQYLLRSDFGTFDRNIRKIVKTVCDARSKTVVLSCEGIYNRFSDLSPAAKQALRNLSEYFNVTLWCVFRDPVSFAMSFFSQLVKNPPNDLEVCHGTAEPPESVIGNPWFLRRLDYAGFVREVEDLFAFPVVHATCYEVGNTVEQARILLGVDAATLQSVPNVNKAVSVLGIDLLQRLNRLRLDPAERQKVVSAIMGLDRLLGPTSSQLQATDEIRKKIRVVTRKSSEYLRERFGISWDDGPDGRGESRCG